MDIRELIIKLYKIGVVKFGTFTLKSGITSPIYFNLCAIISYPDVLQSVADCMWQKVQREQYDYVCGVPYKALPIAAALSLKYDVPLIMRRKELKDHGLGNSVEGVFQAGKSCLLVEDLFTSGMSVLETIEALEHAGLVVQDVVILIDRQQGGVNNVQNRGYKVHSVLTLSEVLQVLSDAKYIEQGTIDAIQLYVRQSQVTI